MRTILSSQSFTLGETILINVFFWGIIICVIVFVVWSIKFSKDDDDHGGKPRRNMMFH